MTAIKIVAMIVGFIAAMVIYPYFNSYVVALLAFIGSVAFGVVAYLVVARLLVELTGPRV